MLVTRIKYLRIQGGSMILVAGFENSNVWGSHDYYVGWLRWEKLDTCMYGVKAINAESD